MTNQHCGDIVKNILLKTNTVLLTGAKDDFGCHLFTIQNLPVLIQLGYDFLVQSLYDLLTYYHSSGLSLLINCAPLTTFQPFEVLLQVISQLQKQLLKSTIKHVYIVCPTQKSLQTALKKELKKKLTFDIEVIIIKHIAETTKYIKVHSLTPEYGGSLVYEHNAWGNVQQMLYKFYQDVDTLVKKQNLIRQQLHSVSAGHRVTTAGKNELLRKPKLLQVLDDGRWLRRNFQEPSSNPDFYTLSKTPLFQWERTKFNISYRKLLKIQRLCEQGSSQERRKENEGQALYETLSKCNTWFVQDGLPHLMVKPSENTIQPHYNYDDLDNQDDFYHQAKVNLTIASKALKQARGLENTRTPTNASFLALVDNLSSVTKSFEKKFERFVNEIGERHKFMKVLEKADIWYTKAQEFWPQTPDAVSRLNNINLSPSSLRDVDQSEYKLDNFLRQYPPLTNDEQRLLANPPDDIADHELRQRASLLGSRCQETERVLRARETHILDSSGDEDWETGSGISQYRRDVEYGLNTPPPRLSTSPQHMLLPSKDLSPYTSPSPVCDDRQRLRKAGSQNNPTRLANIRQRLRDQELLYEQLILEAELRDLNDGGDCGTIAAAGTFENDGHSGSSRGIHVGSTGGDGGSIGTIKYGGVGVGMKGTGGSRIGSSGVVNGGLMRYGGIRDSGGSLRDGDIFSGGTVRSGGFVNGGGLRGSGDFGVGGGTSGGENVTIDGDTRGSGIRSSGGDFGVGDGTDGGGASGGGNTVIDGNTRGAGIRGSGDGFGICGNIDGGKINPPVASNAFVLHPRGKYDADWAATRTVNPAPRQRVHTTLPSGESRQAQPLEAYWNRIKTEQRYLLQQSIPDAAKRKQVEELYFYAHVQLCRLRRRAKNSVAMVDGDSVAKAMPSVTNERAVLDKVTRKLPSMVYGVDPTEIDITNSECGHAQKHTDIDVTSLTKDTRGLYKGSRKPVAVGVDRTQNTHSTDEVPRDLVSPRDDKIAEVPQELYGLGQDRAESHSDNQNKVVREHTTAEDGTIANATDPKNKSSSSEREDPINVVYTDNNIARELLSFGGERTSVVDSAFVMSKSRTRWKDEASLGSNSLEVERLTDIQNTENIEELLTFGGDRTTSIIGSKDETTPEFPPLRNDHTRVRPGSTEREIIVGPRKIKDHERPLATDTQVTYVTDGDFNEVNQEPRSTEKRRSFELCEENSSPDQDGLYGEAMVSSEDEFVDQEVEELMALKSDSSSDEQSPDHGLQEEPSFCGGDGTTAIIEDSTLVNIVNQTQEDQYMVDLPSPLPSPSSPLSPPLPPPPPSCSVPVGDLDVDVVDVENGDIEMLNTLIDEMMLGDGIEEISRDELGQLAKPENGGTVVAEVDSTTEHESFGSNGSGVTSSGTTIPGDITSEPAALETDTNAQHVEAEDKLCSFKDKVKFWHAVEDGKIDHGTVMDIKGPPRTSMVALDELGTRGCKYSTRLDRWGDLDTSMDKQGAGVDKSNESTLMDKLDDEGTPMDKHDKITPMNKRDSESTFVNRHDELGTLVDNSHDKGTVLGKHANGGTSVDKYIDKDTLMNEYGNKSAIVDKRNDKNELQDKYAKERTAGDQSGDQSTLVDRNEDQGTFRDDQDSELANIDLDLNGNVPLDDGISLVNLLEDTGGIEVHQETPEYIRGDHGVYYPDDGQKSSNSVLTVGSEGEVDVNFDVMLTEVGRQHSQEDDAQSLIDLLRDGNEPDHSSLDEDSDKEDICIDGFAKPDDEIHSYDTVENTEVTLDVDIDHGNDYSLPDGDQTPYGDLVSPPPGYDSDHSDDGDFGVVLEDIAEEDSEYEDLTYGNFTSKNMVPEYHGGGHAIGGVDGHVERNSDVDGTIMKSGDCTPAMATDFSSAVIIDIGSASYKAGFSVDERPRVVLPSHIGQTQEEVLESIYEELRCEAHEYPVLLSEPALNSKVKREEVIQTVFELYNVPAAYICVQAVLALFATGKTTGLVYDCGHSSAHCVPVYEGYALPHATKRVPLAGRELTTWFGRMLADRGISLTNGDATDVDTVQNLKEKLCYVVVDYESERKAYYRGERADKPIAFPNGENADIGYDKFRCPEILFNPSMVGLPHDGIHETMYKCVMQCDVELRTSLFNNVVLSGGSVLFPGLTRRLHLELSKLCGGAPGLINIDNTQDAVLLTWQGGALLSRLPNFSSMWITQHDYEEYGPSIVHKKCL